MQYQLGSIHFSLNFLFWTSTSGGHITQGFHRYFKVYIALFQLQCYKRHWNDCKETPHVIKNITVVAAAKNLLNTSISLNALLNEWNSKGSSQALLLSVAVCSVSLAFVARHLMFIPYAFFIVDEPLSHCGFMPTHYIQIVMLDSALYEGEVSQPNIRETTRLNFFILALLLPEKRPRQSS